MVFTERELIIPALRVINNNPGCDTSVLITRLTEEMNPTGHNGEIIPGRHDTYFSQKVRNLKSHDTLKELGFATYEEGQWYITNRGKEYIDEGTNILESLQRQGINVSDIPEDIEDFSTIIIEEGAVVWRTNAQRERSDWLRNYALQYFKTHNDNQISCIVCGFNFEETYGDHGHDFIEIHHKRPVSLMDVEGEQQTLDQALQNLVPLCSNCHRMIHRQSNHMLSIEELRELINQ